MRVAAILSRKRIVSFHKSLDTSYELTEYDDIADLTFAMHRVPHVAALIEAALLKQSTLAATLTMLMQTLPTLVFARGQDIEATFTAIRASRTSTTVVVAEDEPNILRCVRQFLAESRRVNPRAMVLAVLRPKLDALPSPFHSAICALFERGHLARSAVDFAQQCGINPRTADRLISSAGLGSVRRILVVVHTIRAYELLRHPGLPHGRIASHIGFTATRPIDKIVRAVTGESMHNLRGSSDFAPLLPKIMAYLGVSSSDSPSNPWRYRQGEHN